jgi:hypothetical protein
VPERRIDPLGSSSFVASQAGSGVESFPQRGAEWWSSSSAIRLSPSQIRGVAFTHPALAANYGLVSNYGANYLIIITVTAYLVARRRDDVSEIA